MNRLILIGNGFDLAHGMKTSYKDFIADYLCQAVNTFFEESIYEDDLISISFKYSGRFFSEKPIPKKHDEIFDYLPNLINNTNFKFNIDSLLLKNTLKNIDKYNWVDLETEYFNVLLATKQVYKNNNQNEAIKRVNDQLFYLKSRLNDYLQRQQWQFSNLYNREPLVNCFTDKIYNHEMVLVDLEENIIPEKLYFLNFNYTNTFEDYRRPCNTIVHSDFNYIHGGLGGAHGDPIFGFGDELDKRYLEFEDEKNIELFKHIKSFEYLKTKNYYLLTRFIESNDFQVHIYGHSCGLSDRTMLNQIFEHENCKSIKIFYHRKPDGTNDYTEKTYEISRHFKDKGMMRKKVVPFDLSREMPQPEIDKRFTTKPL